MALDGGARGGSEREETALGQRDGGDHWRLALTYEYTVNGQRNDPGNPVRCALQTGLADNPHSMVPGVAAVLLVGGIAVVQGWVRVAG